MNNLKRFLALVLVMSMMLTVVPFGAFAAESTEPTGETTESVADVPESAVEVTADDGTATTALTLGTKPADDKVTGEPFNDDASLTDSASSSHTNYRIPGMVMLNDGTLVASADIRYDYEYDGGGSDIVVSCSEDDGETWNYSVVAYLGDNGNIHAKNSSTMMDPVIITDGEKLYLLYDLFPAGYSLGGGSNTTYAFSATGTGFDSEGRLLLGTTYNSTTCNYYLENGKIYASDGTEQAGYTVDEWFNVSKDGTYVSNLFFADSPFYAYPTSYACMQTSADGGENWSDPELLNIKHDGTKWQVLGPGSGIVTSSGELAFTVYNSDSSISLVHGTSGDWTTVKTDAAINESSIVELSDGTIRAFVKNSSNVITYVDFTYANGTYTAGSAKSTGIANTGGCMISSMMYSRGIDGKDVILVCCPVSSGLRRYGTVFAFTVDPETNEMTKVGSYQITTAYDDQFFAYSDMQELEDGKIALLYEDGCLTYASSPWNGAAAGSGYSHIAYTTIDLEKDLGLTFDVVQDPTEDGNVDVTVQVGKSTTFTLDGEYDENDVTGLDTSVATVELVAVGDSVTYGELRDTANAGTQVTLADCEYTFSEVGDGTWYVTTEKDGTTWYVSPVGKGHASAQTAVSVVHNSDGSVYINNLYTDNKYYWLYVDRSTLKWDRVHNGTNSTTMADAHKVMCTFYLYGQGEDASSPIPGYKLITSNEEITSGSGYLIAFKDANDQLYVMNPTTRTVAAYNQMAAVVTALENATTTVAITGVAVGKTTAVVGNTTYNIRVIAENVTEVIDVDLEVGETKKYTEASGAYTAATTEPNANIVDMALTPVAGTSTKKLVEITSNNYVFDTTKKYLIVNKRSDTNEPNYSVLTNDSYTSGDADWLGTLTGLAMNADNTVDSAELWTITPSGDGYTISMDGSYINMGLKSASMSTTEQVMTMTYTISGWTIVNGTNYLSDLAGVTLRGAFGWNESGDSGNFWAIYELVEETTSSTTEVSFTGVSVGSTYAVVGTTQYNITVTPDVRDITLHVGQTKTFTIDGVKYTMDDATTTPNTSIAILDSVVPANAKLVPVSEIESGVQYLIVNAKTGEVLTDTAITLDGDANEQEGLVTEGTASVNNTELWTITGSAETGYAVAQNGKYLVISDYHAAMSTTETSLTLTYSNSGWLVCDSTTWDSFDHSEGDYYLTNGIAAADYDTDALGSSVKSNYSYWNIYKIESTPVTEVTFTGVAEGTTNATVGDVTFNITVDNITEGNISDFNNIVGVDDYTDGNSNDTNRSDLDMAGKVITSLRITEGATFHLGVDVTGYESVTWTTNDDSVATVDSEGNVIAVTAGATTVTATVVKNGVEESISIPVTVVPSLVKNTTNITTIFYYIDQVDYTDPYYTMFLSTENTSGPAAGHEMVMVSEGEVIWFERPTESAFAWVWTADPWEGYALTYMSSTGSEGEYYPLKTSTSALGSGGDYYKGSTAYRNVISVGTAGGANWENALDELLEEAILIGVNVYPNYGCDGAMSMTRSKEDGVPKVVTSMTFISDPMPHIQKTVNGVLPTTRKRADFEAYTEGMVATVGEYVYFQITVTLERPTVWKNEANGVGAITYTDAIVSDTVLGGAYFYVQANDTNLDGVISGNEVTTGQTSDITAQLNAPWEDDEQVRTINLYLIYEIKDKDIPKFVIDNTAGLSWQYSSEYSKGALTGKADAKASITVVGYAMDNVVIDFGQSFTYTGLTDAHLKYVSLGEHQTKYGTAVVAGVGDEHDDGAGNKYYEAYTVTYTPTAILQEPDAVQLSGTYIDADTEETVSKVINGFLVYPATTVYYEEGFMFNDASTGWSGGAKATMTQNFELLGESVYDSDNVLTGYRSVKQNAYGYDPIYAEMSGANGTQATASDTGSTTTFTFTGTGFDLYANCTEETGYIAVQVKNANGEAVKMYTVNTKVGEAYTDAGDSTDGQSGSMYSLPIISEQGLTHGTYTVKITKIMTGEVKIDGIRIFNTFDESPYQGESAKASSPFAIDLEDNPEFYELRDYVLSALNISDTTSADYGKLVDMAEQVYAGISTDTEAPAVILAQSNGEYVDSDEAQNLLDNGPKNEVYLHAGETLVFKVTTNRMMQLGLKAPAGNTTYSISYTVDGTTKEVDTEAAMNATVDMFYELGNSALETAAEYTITITNEGDNILSVTDLKICDDPNAAFVALTAEDIKTALTVMGYSDSCEAGHTYVDGFCTVCGLGTARNTTTDTEYGTVAEALAAAQSGENVILLTDCSESTVMVDPGITLDLNGFELTASYAVAFDTAHIIDNVGTGCLTIGVKSLVLDEENTMIPVYNGTAYIFTKAGFAIDQNANYQGNGIEIQALACPVNMEAVELLKNGGADNNIEIVIRLTWDTDQGTGSQDFKFTDEVVGSVYSSNNGTFAGYSKMFSMVVIGFENIENLKANIIVTSETDVTYVSSTSVDIT